MICQHCGKTIGDLEVCDCLEPAISATFNYVGTYNGRKYTTKENQRETAKKVETSRERNVV